VGTAKFPSSPDLPRVSFAVLGPPAAETAQADVPRTLAPHEIAEVEVVEMKDEEIALNRPDVLRCPACFLVQNCTLKNFSCILTRCPRVFVRVKPPTVTPAGGAVEPEALANEDEAPSRDGVEKPRPMMTVTDAAAYLKVNRKTIYKLMRRDELRGFRISGDWRFDLDAVERWRLRHEEPSD